MYHPCLELRPNMWNGGHGEVELLAQTLQWGYNDAHDKSDDRGRREELTNRKDISLSTDHLIRVSRNDQILPYVCEWLSEGFRGKRSRTCGTVKFLEDMA